MTKNKKTSSSLLARWHQAAKRDARHSLTVATGIALFAGIAAIGFNRDIGQSPVNAEVGSGYNSLAEAFNNIGTSDNGAGRLANFDGAGLSYSRQDLAAKGYTPGATINYGGAQLKWPSSTSGQADNVIASGQVILLNDPGTALTFLVSSNGGTSTGTGTVVYEDGSSATYTLSAPDWTTGPLAQAVISGMRRNTATGQQTTTTKLYPVSIPLDRTKTPLSITLPSPTTGRMHIFAMGTRPLDTGWSASWGTSPERAISANWTNQTLRSVVHTSTGGSQIRLRFDNSFNPNPVKLGHVTVALQKNGKTPQSTPINVTFNGSQSTTMPAGGGAVSDPVDINIPPQSRLLVSQFLPGTVAYATIHTNGQGNFYATAANGGDRTLDMGNFPNSVPHSFWAFLSGVDVNNDSGTVVALGDSITDGVGSPYDSDTRWTDFLSYRLGGRKGVVNAGIGANKVLGDQTDGTKIGGISAINRQYRDVMAIPGVTTMVLLEGTNDLAAGASAASIQTGLKTLVTNAKQYGLKVYVGTILPYGGALNANTTSEANRNAINNWIRNGGSGADGFIEFDLAMTNGTGNPMRLQGPYNSGDNAHPSAAGYLMMANTVDPSVL